MVAPGGEPARRTVENLLDGERAADHLPGVAGEGGAAALRHHREPRAADIDTAVEKTAAGIAEIAEQTETQSASAEEVRTAIKSVSETTESNAASAEQLAASAEELGAQSHTLQDLVSKFEV